MAEGVSDELFALTFAGAEFVLAAMLVFEFVFVLPGVPQPAASETSPRVTTKQARLDSLKIDLHIRVSSVEFKRGALERIDRGCLRLKGKP